MSSLQYQRVLIKLSGEALRGDEPSGFDPDVLDKLAEQVKTLHELGVSLGIVIGGGNFYRGGRKKMDWLKRPVADSVGMLATVMNGLVLRERFLHAGLPCSLFSAVGIDGVVEPYSFRAMDDALQAGRIVIFGGGTGHPFFTTDTTAALRAKEMEADVLIKATQVDGVYDDDPHINPAAKRFSTLTYIDVLQRDLRVMDATSISFCREYKIPILVMSLAESEDLTRALHGAPVGTFIQD